MNVLVITANRNDALKAGAAPATLRHRTTPEVRFWWPRLDRDGLQGQRFDVITMDPEADDQLTSEQREWLLAFCTYSTTLWIAGAPALPRVEA